MDEFTKAFAALGVVMVAAGVGLLGYLGYTVFLILDAPEKIGFVKFLLANMGAGDRLIYGHAGNEPFELNLTEPARTVILLFFGVVIFWIVAGIARAIIAAGIGIVRIFGTQPPPRT
jgi:hypothetical protein